jgi:hypothetical protein
LWSGDREVNKSAILFVFRLVFSADFCIGCALHFSMKRTVFLLLFCFIAHRASAGDAIAMGYNYAGVWTAVTYNRSSTPRGGPHYHDSAQACLFAVHDLYARAVEDLVRTKIIGRSDETGYVAIARAKRLLPEETDVTVIGRGKSQSEADEHALKKLSYDHAMTNQEIVFRYFSYGADSGKHASAKQKAAGASKSDKGHA